jgi:hypothetical protein
MGSETVFLVHNCRSRPANALVSNTFPFSERL